MHEDTSVEPFVIDFRAYTRDPNEDRPKGSRRASGRRNASSKAGATNTEREAIKRWRRGRQVPSHRAD